MWSFLRSKFDGSKTKAVNNTIIREVFEKKKKNILMEFSMEQMRVGIFPEEADGSPPTPVHFCPIESSVYIGLL